MGTEAGKLNGGSSSGSSLGSLVSCLAYSLCSISMVLSNKALAAAFNVDIPVLLLAIQCGIAVILVEGFRAAGVVSYSNFQTKVALQWLPVNLCFVLMLFTSFRAMRFLNVPIITVFKNLTNIVIVTGDWYWYGQRVTWGVVLAFGIMVMGAGFAAKNDVMFSFEGYAWMSANCLATAAYVLYTRKMATTLELSKFGMAFYNNLLSIPLLLPLAISLGDIDEAAEHWEVVTSTSFLAVNVVAGSMGFFLNLATLWCISATSATTYALVGSINKIPVSFLGAYLFNAAITAQGAIYIAMSMCGGFIYSYVKIVEKQANTDRK